MKIHRPPQPQQVRADLPGLLGGFQNGFQFAAAGCVQLPVDILGEPLEQGNQIVDPGLVNTRIAEKEIFLKGKLQEAIANQDYEAATQLETQLKNERIRLQEERESRKNQIRKANS